MSDTLHERIAEILTAHGLTASAEYPGWISVWAEDLLRADHFYAFGTVNGHWQGQRMDGDGEYQGHTLETTIDASETDVATIAAAILEALK